MANEDPGDALAFSKDAEEEEKVEIKSPMMTPNPDHYSDNDLGKSNSMF